MTLDETLENFEAFYALQETWTDNRIPPRTATIDNAYAVVGRVNPNSSFEMHADGLGNIVLGWNVCPEGVVVLAIIGENNAEIKLSYGDCSTEALKFGFIKFKSSFIAEAINLHI